MDKSEQLRIRQKLKDNFPHYAAKCLKIRTKSQGVIPFELNIAQDYLHKVAEEQLARTGKVRIIVCKGRQMGLSTYIEGRYFHKATHQFGKRAFILTHEDAATQNLYEMALRFYEHLPVVVKPSTKRANANELLFDALDSGYKLGTAGNKSVGRSSTIQYLHASEVAFYQHADEHAKGIMQAVPEDYGTEVFIESTANGVGNWFHQLWQQAEAGLSEFIAVFIPWYWLPEYRKEVPEGFKLDHDEAELKRLYNLSDEQIAWRRSKINSFIVAGSNGLKSFQQEYPNNPTEAFIYSGDDAYIDADLVMAARKNVVESYGKKLMGVDPARYGDDRSSIAIRRGRKIEKIISFTKKNTMELAGIVNTMIEEEKPDFVFVDVGGLGAGVVDRLIELRGKHLIIPVNAGSTPNNVKSYLNKRAEMWGRVKEWLSGDLPVQIPDKEPLMADLCNILYTVDSQSRLKMESKEDMKKRGVRSPDEADAVCLTFYYPESKLLQNQTHSNKLAADIMANHNRVIDIRMTRK